MLFEREAEFFPRRHIGLAKPGKVRRDNMKPVREKRDQVQEHVARAREAVQDQQLRRIPSPACNSISEISGYRMHDDSRPVAVLASCFSYPLRSGSRHG